MSIGFPELVQVHFPCIVATINGWQTQTLFVSFSSTTRFVVTLTGVSNDSVTSDPDEDEEGGASVEGKDVRALQKTVLKRNIRYNNQAVEATVTGQEVVKLDDSGG